MKYVGVKHEPEQTVTYWFEAPDNIARQISVGSSVICDTRRGSMSGIVEQIMDGIPQNIARSVIGDHFPLKKVLAVSKDIPIQNIRISWEIDSNPSPEEIAERVREYYNHGKFDSPIICDEDGNLEEGYSAYLVAKMLAHDTLRVLMYSREENREEGSDDDWFI